MPAARLSARLKPAFSESRQLARFAVLTRLNAQPNTPGGLLVLLFPSRRGPPCTGRGLALLPGLPLTPASARRRGAALRPARRTPAAPAASSLPGALPRPCAVMWGRMLVLVRWAWARGCSSSCACKLASVARIGSWWPSAAAVVVAVSRRRHSSTRPSRFSNRRSRADHDRESASECCRCYVTRVDGPTNRCLLMPA